MPLKYRITNQGRGISAVDTKQRDGRLGRSGCGCGYGISPDTGAGNNCPSEGCRTGGKHAAEAGSGEGQNGVMM